MARSRRGSQAAALPRRWRPRCSDTIRYIAYVGVATTAVDPSRRNARAVRSSASSAPAVGSSSSVPDAVGGRGRGHERRVVARRVLGRAAGRTAPASTSASVRRQRRGVHVEADDRLARRGRTSAAIASVVGSQVYGGRQRRGPRPRDAGGLVARRRAFLALIARPPRSGLRRPLVGDEPFRLGDRADRLADGGQALAA